MLLKKVILTSMLSASIAAMPMLAQADALVIHNNTTHDSTSIINNGACSNKLSGGVTKAKSTNTISEFLLRIACGLSPSNCKADVYANDQCAGAKIATVLFDIKTGIKGPIENVPNSGFVISGSGFTINADEQ